MKGIRLKGSVKSSRVVALALVMAAFTLGYWMRGSGTQTQASLPFDQSVEQEASSQPRKRTLYVDPMMHIPPQEKPGKCPVCGMELVPVSAEEAAHEENLPRLKLSPEAMKWAEIRVAPVERKFVSAEVRAFGRIEYDPVHVLSVTAPMPGVINRVYVERAGISVRWGQPLFDIYSSDLYQTEQEFIEAMKFVPGFFTFQTGKPYSARDTSVQTRRPPKEMPADSPEVKAAQQKLAGIRNKLHLLGLQKKDVDEVMTRSEPRGIATVSAQKTGFIIQQNATKGTFVNTGTLLFAIADPRYVWVKLDVYESDFPWIRLDQEVAFQTDAYPGETFNGRIIFIDPFFDSKTRSFKVGVICPTSDMRFKPEMLVRAVISTKLTADGKVASDQTPSEKAPLVIPSTAPMITGKRAIVYLSVPGEERTYEGREIVLGPRAQDYYLVRDGLKEGDMVVVNGNFKIDSAVEILAKPSMMNKKGSGLKSSQETPKG